MLAGMHINGSALGFANADRNATVGRLPAVVALGKAACHKSQHKTL